MIIRSITYDCRRRAIAKARAQGRQLQRPCGRANAEHVEKLTAYLKSPGESQLPDYYKQNGLGEFPINYGDGEHERVLSVRRLNHIFDNESLAADELLLTAHSAKFEAVHHYVVSWPAGIHPEQLEIDAALDRLKELTRTSELKSLLVTHGDTKNIHVHVLDVCVEPLSGRKVNPNFHYSLRPIESLQAGLAIVAFEHGWPTQPNALFVADRHGLSSRDGRHRLFDDRQVAEPEALKAWREERALARRMEWAANKGARASPAARKTETLEPASQTAATRKLEDPPPAFRRDVLSQRAAGNQPGCILRADAPVSRQRYAMRQAQELAAANRTTLQQQAAIGFHAGVCRARETGDPAAIVEARRSPTAAEWRRLLDVIQRRLRRRLKALRKRLKRAPLGTGGIDQSANEGDAVLAFVAAPAEAPAQPSGTPYSGASTIEYEREGKIVLIDRGDRLDLLSARPEAVRHAMCIARDRWERPFGFGHPDVLHQCVNWRPDDLANPELDDLRRHSRLRHALCREAEFFYRKEGQALGLTFGVTPRWFLSAGEDQLLQNYDPYFELFAVARAVESEAAAEIAKLIVSDARLGAQLRELESHDAEIARAIRFRARHVDVDDQVWTDRLLEYEVRRNRELYRNDCAPVPASEMDAALHYSKNIATPQNIGALLVRDPGSDEPWHARSWQALSGAAPKLSWLGVPVAQTYLESAFWYQEQTRHELLGARIDHLDTLSDREKHRFDPLLRQAARSPNAPRSPLSQNCSERLLRAALLARGERAPLEVSFHLISCARRNGSLDEAAERLSQRQGRVVRNLAWQAEVAEVTAEPLNAAVAAHQSATRGWGR